MWQEFTSAIAKRGNWYAGYVEELPGVSRHEKNFERGEEKP